MLRDERLELRHELRAAAGLELGLDPLLVGEQPELLEVADVVAKRLVDELGERLPVPEIERLAQQPRALERLLAGRLGAQPLEPPQVEVVAVRRRGRSPERGVRTRSRPSALRSATIEFWRDVVAVFGGLSPQIDVDEVVGRDDVTRAQQQEREHGALPRRRRGRAARPRPSRPRAGPGFENAACNLCNAFSGPPPEAVSRS